MKVLRNLNEGIKDYTGTNISFNGVLLTVKNCILTHLNSIQGDDEKCIAAMAIALKLFECKDGNELELTKDDFDFIMKETEKPLHAAIVRVPFNAWRKETKELNKDR